MDLKEGASIPAGCEIYSMKPVCLAKIAGFRGITLTRRGFYRIERCKTAHLHQKSRQNSLYGRYYHASHSSLKLFEAGNSNFLCASVVTLRRLSFTQCFHIQRACWAHFTLLGFLRRWRCRCASHQSDGYHHSTEILHYHFYYRLVCWSVLLLRFVGNRNIVRISLRHHKM